MGVGVRPLQDRILVKQLAEEEKTKGGIIIPDSAKEKPHQGKVVAVGKGKKLEDGSVRALDIKEGNTVLFDKNAMYGASIVKIGSEEYIMLKEEDILAVIEK